MLVLAHSHELPHKFAPKWLGPYCVIKILICFQMTYQGIRSSRRTLTRSRCIGCQVTLDQPFLIATQALFPQETPS